MPRRNAQKNPATPMPEADILLAGGGMVGLSLALALAGNGFAVTVLERETWSAQHLPEFDGRVCAIAAASRDFLEGIGVWSLLEPHAQPIHQIRVAEGEAPVFLHFARQSEHAAPMGYIVENRHIRQALARAVEGQSRICVREARSVSGWRSAPGRGEVTLEGGEVVSAPLVVACDGRESRLRQLAGLTSRVHDYGQKAIVCTIAHSRAHAGLALEKFLPVGPFAVLPMTGNRSSLVWTEQTTHADALLQLEDADFLQEIRRRMGDFWGEIAVEGPRFAYPLNWVHVPLWRSERLVLAGDAAHGIHPLAGQGLNLGLRDVEQLAKLLTKRRQLGQDVGAADVLEAYAASRRVDSLAMEVAMHGFNRLFSNADSLLRPMRRLGLAAVEALPQVKRFFMHYAMGYR